MAQSYPLNILFQAPKPAARRLTWVNTAKDVGVKKNKKIILIIYSIWDIYEFFYIFLCEPAL